MARISHRSLLSRLTRFLDRLERDAESLGSEYFCALGASRAANALAGRYAWVANHDVTKADQAVSERSRLFVAARSFGLHKAIVQFVVRTTVAGVLLHERFGSRGQGVFRGRIVLAPRPPILSRALRYGTPVSRGCGISTDRCLDPTISFKCKFDIQHEGEIQHSEERIITLGLMA